jgi:hypothetical protein
MNRVVIMSWGLLVLWVVSAGWHSRDCVNLYDRYQMALRRRDRQVCTQALELGLLDICHQDQIMLQSTWHFVVLGHYLEHMYEVVTWVCMLGPRIVERLVLCPEHDTQCQFNRAKINEGLVNLISSLWMMIPCSVVVMGWLVYRHVRQVQRASLHSTSYPHDQFNLGAHTTSWRTSFTEHPLLHETQPSHNQQLQQIAIKYMNGTLD